MDDLVQLEHRQARALDHALQNKALDQRIRESAGHRTPGHRGTFVACIDEDRLQHAGDRDEIDQVGFAHGTPEGAKLLTNRDLLPDHALSEPRQVSCA